MEGFDTFRTQPKGWKDNFYCKKKERGLIVGLTGGIACGKTTVAEFLAQHGADVVDLDKIGHQLLKKGSPVFAQIVEAFGTEILGESGDISRTKLGDIVFQDSKCRLRLNQITHPVIIERAWTEAQRLATLGKEKIVVIDSPLLIEAGLQNTVDFVVVVVSDEKIQLERLIQRNLKQKNILSVEEAQARIDSQMPLSEKIKYAHFVIENNGGLDELKKKVAELWEYLKSQCRKNGCIQNFRKKS